VFLSLEVRHDQIQLVYKAKEKRRKRKKFPVPPLSQEIKDSARPPMSAFQKFECWKLFVSPLESFVACCPVSQKQDGQPTFELYMEQDATHIYRMIPRTNFSDAGSVFQVYTNHQISDCLECPQSR
jgi:hypothetical protein